MIPRYAEVGQLRSFNNFVSVCETSGWNIGNGVDILSKNLSITNIDATNNYIQDISCNVTLRCLIIWKQIEKQCHWYLSEERRPQQNLSICQWVQTEFG